MSPDRREQLETALLAGLMKRDAEIWSKRMYFDHANSPEDLAILRNRGRVFHQRREEE
jgi:hypothetical protein